MTLTVPVVAVELAVRVSVDVPVPVTDDGEKPAVTPEGRPPAERATVCAEDPPVGASEIVVFADEPRATVTVAGEAPIVKLFPVTVRETVVVCVADEPVPVTVRV
jgi:hypothetical protein